MNERLSTNVEVDGSRVGVDLVHKVVAVVDQVFLQVSKPETLGLGKKKRKWFYLQYSITTKSSLFFRLVVQAPRRLTILRCLWKKKSVFRAWLSWLPSQVHHDLELSHECFQVGDVSCQLHHLDGNHCFFLPRLDPESISLHHLGRERESQYPGRNPPCKRADPPSTIIPTFPPPKKKL